MAWTMKLLSLQRDVSVCIVEKESSVKKRSVSYEGKNYKASHRCRARFPWARPPTLRATRNCSAAERQPPIFGSRNTNRRPNTEGYGREAPPAVRSVAGGVYRFGSRLLDQRLPRSTEDGFSDSWQTTRDDDHASLAEPTLEQTKRNEVKSNEIKSINKNLWGDEAFFNHTN
jgi:hypothetical protein